MTSLKIPESLELVPVKNPDLKDRPTSAHSIGPEEMFTIIDPAIGRVWGFVVVDNTRRGPGLGGIRMAQDVTLDEIKRLARAMTLKNAAANLPFGGGKAGIVADPANFNDKPGMKRDLISLFAETIFPIENFITAPDMGINENDIQLIYEINSIRLKTEHHQRGGAGRPTEQGGIPIDVWGLTAHGLFAALETLFRMSDNFDLSGSKVVVQGYGNVGARVAAKLSKAGAVIVGASDINSGLWNAKGLDVEEMNRAALLKGGLNNYTGHLDQKFSPDKLDWLLERPCDILIPAARPDAITSRNVDRIHCRIVCQGANSPSSKTTEFYLQKRRGIVSLNDFIVNVGGVMGCAVELKMTIDKVYKARIIAEGNNGRSYIEGLVYNTVSNNVEIILRLMREKKESDLIFREHALQIALERLDNSTESWL